VALERWLILRQAEGMSAGNRNEYRQALVGFANWCVRRQRMAANPFTGVAKADARLDRRRQRRALTETEIVKLLDVARRRPLEEAMTVKSSSRRRRRTSSSKRPTRRTARAPTSRCGGTSPETSRSGSTRSSKRSRAKRRPGGALFL
jgi:hypothetical protein